MKILLITLFVACAFAQDDYLFAWHEECGVKLEQDFNIIGGEIATPNDYPWMISMQVFIEDLHFCGGAIISPDWILTAAHCADGLAPDNVLVAVGEHDFSDDSDGAQHIGVTNIIVHPDYSPRTVDNDIALLQLENSLTFDDTITAICAPNPDDDYTGANAIVAGWGDISDGIFPEYPDELYYVEVPVISNEECEDDYGRGQITENMICAGDKVSTDACQGDSGGPLWVDDGGYASHIGIVSWGIGCADGYPGVYARTTQYIDWVAENIGA